MTSRPSRLPWRDTLAPFAMPCPRRGLLAVASSAAPYLALTVAIYATLGVSLPLTVALTILAAGFLVRVFVVFHDCAHGSLLPSRRANAALGTALGLLVLSHLSAGAMTTRCITPAPATSTAAASETLAR